MFIIFSNVEIGGDLNKNIVVKGGEDKRHTGKVKEQTEGRHKECR